MDPDLKMLLMVAGSLIGLIVFVIVLVMYINDVFDNWPTNIKTFFRRYHTTPAFITLCIVIGFLLLGIFWVWIYPKHTVVVEKEKVVEKIQYTDAGATNTYVVSCTLQDKGGQSWLSADIEVCHSEQEALGMATEAEKKALPQAHIVNYIILKP